LIGDRGGSAGRLRRVLRAATFGWLALIAELLIEA
jgi:hypothetical protein